MNILINAFSSKAGGGKSIVDNYLNVIVKNNKENKYIVLINSEVNYKEVNNSNIIYIKVPSIFNSIVFIPLFYFFYLHYILFKFKIDIVFNFGDLVLPIIQKQIYFFDWAYLINDNKIIWQKMNSKSLIMRKIKIFLISCLIRLPKLIIVQSSEMQLKLEEKFGLKNIKVYPTPISEIIKMEKKSFAFENCNTFKLLFLSNYAPHKNFEILQSVVKTLNDRKMDVTIFTTLSQESFNALFSKEFLLENERIIKNIGYVEHKYVYSLLNDCDSLFLPTLLESYGLPYYESMINNTSIITSNYQFALDACGDSAYYFDPLDYESIVDSIDLFIKNNQMREEKKNIGKSIVERLPKWNTAFYDFEKLMITILKGNN